MWCGWDQVEMAWLMDEHAEVNDQFEKRNKYLELNVN